MNHDLIYQLEQHLCEDVLQLLHAGTEIASEQGQSLYLVGGVVRDLLLGRANFDLDLVVEGDAIKLASLLGQREGGEVVVHPRFGTAKFRRGGLAFDLATARAETYSRPGVLPAVHPGSIEDDLRRRDFTINAMAINLSGDSFGKLIDPYGGESDLKLKLIRILHQRSFIDDATRILRALRYEMRLGFQLEAGTEELLRRDVAMLHTMTGERIRHELELILAEERPEKILHRAEELGVLKEIYPTLSGDSWIMEKFEQARLGSYPSLRAIYFSLLASRFSPQEGEAFIERLKIPGAIARIIRDTLSLKAGLRILETPKLPHSAIYRLLHGYSSQAIVAGALASDSALIRQNLELYLNKLRYVKPSLNGRALQQMGLSPGPRLGEILHALEEARLDQKVKSKDQEEELVRRWLSE